MSRTFFLVAAAMFLAAALADDAGNNYVDGLAHCDEPAPSSATFSAVILELLDDLPAAAAPTGFAALELSSGSGPGSVAFARGLCLGVGAGGPCEECLAGAAKKAAADGCAGSGSRRGAVWSGSPPYCSLAFGDTNGTSAVEAAYRECQLVVSSGAGRLRDAGARGLGALALSLSRRAANSSSGPLLATAATDMAAAGSRKVPVRALAQCARDRAPADCATCLQLSAQHLPKCWGPRDEGLAAAAVSVVAYDCYLGLELELELAPPVYQESPIWKILCFTLLAVILGVFAAAAAAAYVLRRRIPGWLDGFCM